MPGPEELLDAAKAFGSEWYPRVTYAWLCEKMNLQKGRKPRADVKEMYLYLSSELQKQWPINEPEPVRGERGAARRR